ncbi:radical SAM-linked protein [Anaerosolibacter carboniphilus]|uniref:Radical SAM-linked protein n=1 Tax=Anaerosolibacter carboniphilus TaxID=1417629 RepID=A0A841KXH3_9FIRM|nr:TIGR03936 family radical SAM-associated protein [Anaerosolibacter carboniphilus]MBB6214879.1 radical SAM-linked protein [Anaerosolibacter carboniphilus]
MNKLRVKFIKTDLMKFISHLDLLRLMERALRRADIKLSFSQGFNPHPKISFATAVPIGLSSEAEYMDIELDERVELDHFINRVNEQLPQGIKILSANFIEMKMPALMAIVDASSYIVNCPLEGHITKEAMEIAIKSFMNQGEIIIHKASKKNSRNGAKEINIKGLIFNMELLEHQESSVTLKMMLATGSKGNLKPEILLEKFKHDMGLPIALEHVRVHRLELYTLLGDALVTPLEING